MHPTTPEPIIPIPIIAIEEMERESMCQLVQAYENFQYVEDRYQESIKKPGDEKAAKFARLILKAEKTYIEAYCTHHELFGGKKIEIIAKSMKIVPRPSTR